MTENRAVAAIAGMRRRVRSEPLGPGPSPEQVAIRLRREPGLVCLRGEWAGATALITCRPVVVAPVDADPAEVLATQPVIDGHAGTDTVAGGWFGWLGYDGTHRLAFYDHLLRQTGTQWYLEALVSDDASFAALCEAYRAVLAGDDEDVPWHAGVASGADRDEHLDAVERAVEEVRAGEIYQANICTRLDGAFGGEPVGLFAAASSRLRPAFGAFVAAEDADGRTVVSLSPELFLRRRGRTVLTRPIKGTWPRTGGASDRGAASLRASVKDAAENVMIVDLMRNDLGRVCRTGSVRASALLAVEPHPGVWHLVSTVTGELRDGADDADLVRATFPPGSVTGAPKSRAVEIIARYESRPRGTYTGAVGFVSPMWGLEFNVAIRTFEIAGGSYRLGVGGGITADSVPMREWRECLDKAAPLLAAVGAGAPPAAPDARPTRAQRAGGLLETVLVLDGRAVRLADHLARLDRSARELYGTGLPAALAERARRCAAGSDVPRAALRITLAPDGAVRLDCAAIGPAPTARDAVTVPARAGCQRHKWADRAGLAATERAVGAHRVAVFEDGTLLETTRGNLFVLAGDGTLLTPALTDAVLPGITRRAVLDLAHDRGWPVRLGPVRAPDLLAARAVFWTSSLSLAVPIHSLDGRDLPVDDEAVADLAHALAPAPVEMRPFVR